MALVKTVEMRVLADAGDAQKRLDDLSAKAKELDGNAIKMRFRVDDQAGQAQLDEIRAKAERLGFKDVSVKVKVDGSGRAVAELEAVKHEMDTVERKGIRERLGGLLGGLGGGGLGEGASGALGGVPLLGSLLGPVAGAGNGAGLAVIVAGVAALANEIVAVGSGLAAAGAGAGAFYLLAHPAISNLSADVKSLGAANQALGIAQQKYLIDPTKAHAKALHEAQVQYQAIYKQMGQDAGPAAAGVLKLHDEYVKLSSAFAPQAFQVFGAGLKVISGLLPAIVPFASTFASVLTKLLGQLGKFTASKGFADWLKQFHGLEGPALNSIGEGIGKVAVAFGKLLTTMSGKDVAHALNLAFGGIAGAINLIAGGVRNAMQAWDLMSRGASAAVHGVASAWDWLAGHVSGAIHNVESFISHLSWSKIRNGLAEAVSSVISFLHGLPAKIQGIFAPAITWLNKAGVNIVTGLLNGIIAAAPQVISWWQGLPAKIVGALGNMRSLLVKAGQALISGLISGIQSQLPSLLGILANVATTIAEHKGPIEKDRQLLVPHGQAIMAGLMAGIGSRRPELKSLLAGVTGDISGTLAHARAAGAAGGGGSHYEIHLHGVIDSQGAAREIHQLMREYKRNGGGAALGLG
jgi:phage-related protein